MAKANLYDVYDISGRLVLANAQRKDIANMLEMSVRTLDDRLKFTANTVIRGYTIQCTVKRNYEKPVNNEVRKIMATGIWEETCRPFRILSERMKNGKH